MNIKPIKKEYIILAGLIVVILWVLSYVMVFKPMAGSLKAKKAVIEKKIVEINNAKSAKANLDKLKRELAEIEKKVTYYKDKLPAEKEMPSLLKGFTDMANQCRIKFITIQPQDTYSQSPAVAAPYIEIPITINLICSYHDLGRFINMIENSDRFMKVTDLTINTNPDPMVHNIRLIVNIFVLKKK